MLFPLAQRDKGTILTNPTAQGSWEQAGEQERASQVPKIFGCQFLGIPAMKNAIYRKKKKHCSALAVVPSPLLLQPDAVKHKTHATKKGIKKQSNFFFFM